MGKTPPCSVWQSEVRDTRPGPGNSNSKGYAVAERMDLRMGGGNGVSAICQVAGVVVEIELFEPGFLMGTGGGKGVSAICTGASADTASLL